jgi:hypothetical protein
MQAFNCSEPLKLFTGTADVPSATSTVGARISCTAFNYKWTAQALHWDRGRPVRNEHRRCEDFAPIEKHLFALRAQCGRDARGPSEELERSTASCY